MTATKFGALIAGILALVWIWWGFWAFVLVALAMVVGAFVGRIVDGRLDVSSLIDAVRGKRSSS
ncbi:DUF2273 domain-containing protein [Glaciibacter flavus]|uniref:DUF2273 domain-containing protein n=1 Tax=Orlajensenia flava TaxID=2565934 RepID=A0A4S4FXM1_9MICO|nr:DUF2273 domain-containing protein [Glaciibacter flavus]THG35583.1 DUF2273 domain-containing protein [Glaciibacter flavus]